MNLFELFVKVGVDDQASGPIQKLSAWTVAKGQLMADGIKAGTKALIDFSKQAINSFAEYEQLVGGVDTLFKESSQKVQDYASKAFQTAGLSANEYMETVTSFSASLLQSTGRGEQTDLEALEDSLTARYEETKESLSKEYDVRKETLAAEVEAFKKARAEELAAIDKNDKDARAKHKEQTSLLLADMKEANKKELAELKDSNTKKLNLIKASIKDQVKAAEEANMVSVTTLESQELAAELANQAIIDMSDNANKMGTSMESIQNAYQGFAKANYTMLDNLKLGYGGTKEEMERLIEDANRLKEANGEMADLSISSFANIVEAIHLIQEEMGIAGTTSKEAASTIQGSISSMKAAWENLVTALADENANLDPLIENLVASVETVIANVVPKIGVALNSTIKLVRDLIPVIVQEIPLLIEQNLPVLAEAAVGLIEAFIDGINSSKETLITTVLDVVLYSVEAFFNVLPQITQVGVETLVALAEGISTTIPKLIPVATEAIVKIVDTLTNPDSTQRIINASVETIKSLASGLIENIPKLVESAVEIITSLFEFLTDPGLLREMFNAAVEVIKTLAQSLIQEIPQLLESAIEIILGLVNFLLEPSTLMALIDSALEIILTLVNSLVDNVDELLNAAIEIIMALVQFLLEPENLDKIISAAIDLVITLVTALVESAYLLIDAAVQLILSLVEFLTQPDRIQQLIEVGIKLVLAIIDGLVSMLADIGEAGADLVMRLWDAFTNVDWKGLGKGIVDGIWNGLKSAWNTLSSWVSDAWNSLFGDKDEISLSAPSSSYSTQDLLAMKTGQKSVTGYINPNAQPLGSTVNVTQNIYSSAKTPSELMTEAYYQQRMGLVN